jgi:hypothetical protein
MLSPAQRAQRADRTIEHTVELVLYGEFIRRPSKSIFQKVWDLIRK